jgi:hypothetical protein
MEFTHRHTLYQNYCKQLIGLQLIKVKYAELINPDTEPQYKTHFTDIDTVAYSVFLYDDNATVFEICWDSLFVQYEIGVKLNTAGLSPIYQMWDVSNQSIWQKVIGATITNVTIGWQEINTYKPGQQGILGLKRAPKTISPQYITLEFSNGEIVFISASQFLNDHDDEVVGMKANLLVTNSVESARQVGIIQE